MQCLWNFTSAVAFIPASTVRNIALVLQAAVLNTVQPLGITDASQLLAVDRMPGDYPASIGPSSMRNLLVRCTPMLAVEYQATMQIATSDKNNAILAVPINCTGTTSCSDGFRNKVRLVSIVVVRAVGAH
jgi:hypothetical protein